MRDVGVEGGAERLLLALPFVVSINFGLALVIDRPILDLLKIEPDTPLDVSTDGRQLIVTPAKASARRKKFEAAQDWAHKRYEKAFRKLAEQFSIAKIVGPVFLSLDEVLEIHKQQIERYGGSAGLRDAAALQSAVATPEATFGGKLLHTSIPAMAAAYLFHLCQNRPFIDGNKRVAANAAVAFLLMNDWEPTFEEDELVEVVLAVASGGLSKHQLFEIFESSCSPSEDA